MRKKDGKSLSYLCKKYNINSAGIKYLIRLIDKHGFNILRTVNNRKFNKNEKERIINRVLLNNEPLISVAIDEGLCPTDKISVVGIGGTIGVSLKDCDSFNAVDERKKL